MVTAGQRSDGCVRVAVHDEGIGIANDRLHRLFQPYDRLGRESSGIEGTGVGLALCKRLAELMGCELGVESIEGRGSTFWLDLPAALERGAKRHSERLSEPQRSPGRSTAPPDR